MKRYFLSSLLAFLLGSVAGYAGLLIALHHIREPLAQSVHYAWYDWFMYLAWPGYGLARHFFDPTDPAHKAFCLPVISLANGLVAALAVVLFFPALPLVKMARRQTPREPLAP